MPAVAEKADYLLWRVVLMPRKSTFEKRVFTDEELQELGKLTIDKVKEAIDAGESEKAKQLIDGMYAEFTFLHDGYMCWTAGLQTYIYEHYGIDALTEAEKFAHTLEWKTAFSPERFAKVMGTPISDAPAEVSFKEDVENHCRALKGHVHQSIIVTEDEDKVTVTVHPCGSGGRLVGDIGFYDKGGARVAEKCPVTWGLSNFPIYCVHCPDWEIREADAGIPLRFVHPTGEDGYSIGPDCKWVMYKDQASIPGYYYERIGKKKP